ncbi:hypothetical protein ACJMK2_043890 [Sinanodonta woodiana]|uniref:Microtubule-associated protein futsch n=1 Tax=Sinanodonta woodiana TaxID=1069815 RepID=A0ABD3VYB6_SINWO
MNSMMDSNAVTGEEMEFSSPAKMEAALLLVIGEPLEEGIKSLILTEVTKGFQCWNTELTGIDINDELAQIANRADLGEEGPEGERVIRHVSERLATEVLVNPQTQTLKAALKNFLHTVTNYKHLIYAGHAFQGSGAWILQDDTFTFNNFVHLFKESGTDEILRQQEGSTLTVYTHSEGEWTNGHIAKNDFSKIFKVDLNPPKSLESSHGVLQFTAYVGNFVKTRQLSDLLPSSDVVGSIKFSRPTLYIFPGCQGDSALFGISGFNLLVNGGYSKKACFWDFTRHLDRIDAALMTHLGTDNLFGINSVLKRKSIENVHPEIGFLYLNASDKIKHATTENVTPDSKEPQLLVNLAEEGNKLVEYAKQIGQPPHPCSRTAATQQLEPMNLYRKVGHGSLDMYILNPVTDSKELKEFYQQWNQQAKQFGTHLHMPIPNTQSICCLLVWRSADPTEMITRILFPGNAPQHKVIEGLDRLKNLDILKHAKCNNKDLQTKPSAKKTSAPAPAARPPLGKPKAPPVTTKAEPVSTPRKVEHTPRIEMKPKPKPTAAPKAKKEDLNKKTAKGSEKADKTKSSSSSSPSKASTKSLTPTETPKDAISPVNEPIPQEPEGSDPLVQVDETGSEPRETELSQQPDETFEPDVLEPISMGPVDDLGDFLGGSPSHLPEPEESEHTMDEMFQQFPNRGALDKDAMRELGIYDEDEDMADLQQYGQTDGMNAEEEEEEVHPEPLPEPVAYSPSSYTQEPDIIPSMQVSKEEPITVKELAPVICPSAEEPDDLPLKPEISDISKPDEDLYEKLYQESSPDVEEVSDYKDKEVIKTSMLEAIPLVGVTMEDSPKLEDAKDIQEEEEDVKEEATEKSCKDKLEIEVEAVKWENVEEASNDMEEKLTPEDVELSASHPQESEEEVAAEDDYDMLSPKACDSGVASDFQEYRDEEESGTQAHVDLEDQQRESVEEQHDIYSKEQFEKTVEDMVRNTENKPYLPEEALNPVDMPFEKEEQEYMEQTKQEDDDEEAQHTPNADSGEVTPDEDLPRPRAAFDSMQSSFTTEKHDFEEQDVGIEDGDRQSPLSQDEIFQQPAEEIPQEEGPTKTQELEHNIVLSPETQEEFSDRVSEEDYGKHAEDESGSCEQGRNSEATSEDQPELVTDEYEQSRLHCEHNGQDRSMSHIHEGSPAEDQSAYIAQEDDEGRSEDEHYEQERSISQSHEASPDEQSENVIEDYDQGRFEDEHDDQDRSINHSHESTPEDQSEQVTEECDQGRFEYEHNGQDESVESPQEDSTDSDMRHLIQEHAEDEPSIEQSDSFMPQEAFDKCTAPPNPCHLVGTSSQQTDYLTPESEATDPSHGTSFGYQQMEDQEGDNDDNDSIEDVSQEDEKDVDESYPARGLVQEQDTWQQGDCAGGNFADYSGGMSSHPFGLAEQTGYNPFHGLDQQSRLEPQPGTYFSPSEQQSEEKEFDPLAEWGQPMGLPSPPPPEEAQAVEESPAKETKDTKMPKDTKSPKTKTKTDAKKPDPKRLSTAPAPKARSASASNKQAAKSSSDTKSTNGVPETKSKVRLSLGGNPLNTSKLDAASDKKNPAAASPKARPTSAPVNGKPASAKSAESKSKANGTKRPATTTGNRSSPATVPMPPLPPFNAFYLDLAYIPNHGNPRYVDIEFFKRIRARYYVLSTLTPSAQTLNALLEAKKTWEDKHAEVTLIPTHDNDTLYSWMGNNKEQLQDLKITVAPSASRCTIQLQDHETSCSAFRLEF